MYPLPQDSEGVRIINGDLATSSKEATKRSLLLVHVAMIVVQLSYAGETLVLKSVLSTPSFNQLVFAIYRDVVALVVLFTMGHLLERKKRTPVTRLVFGGFIISGFVGAFAAQLLLLKGLSIAESSAIASVKSFAPLLSYAIAITFKLEEIKWCRRDGWFKILAMILGLLGVVVMEMQGPAVLGPLRSRTDSDNSLHLMSSAEQHPLGLEPYQLGTLLCMLSVICYSIYYNIQVPIFKLYPAPYSFAAYAYLCGTCCLVATAAFIVNGSDWIIKDPYTLAAILYQGAVVSGFAMGVLCWGTQRAGPVLIASYFPVQTFTTYVASYLFFHDSVYLGQLSGAIIVIVGLYSLTFGKIESARLDAENQTQPLNQPFLKHVNVQ